VAAQFQSLLALSGHLRCPAEEGRKNGNAKEFEKKKISTQLAHSTKLKIKDHAGTTSGRCHVRL
jgi:hypothetical protein